MATIGKRLTKSGHTHRVQIRSRRYGFKLSKNFKHKAEAKLWAAEAERLIEQLCNGTPMTESLIASSRLPAAEVQRLIKQLRPAHATNPSEAAKQTIADAIDRYIAEVLPNKAESTQCNEAQQLGWWRDRIGQCAIATLQKNTVVEPSPRLYQSAIFI